MDGRHWTILSLSAMTTYQNFVGSVVRPELRLECVQRREGQSFHVVLESGPLEFIHDGYVVLDVKFDDSEPETGSWDGLADYKSWSYDPGDARD